MGIHNMRRKSTRRKNEQKLQNIKAMKIVATILLILTLALGINAYRILDKQNEYNKQIEALERQIESEQDRKNEIEDMKDYMSTREFIEETAKSKLGLVYKNEIIFRKSN